MNRSQRGKASCSSKNNKIEIKNKARKTLGRKKRTRGGRRTMRDAERKTRGRGPTRRSRGPTKHASVLKKPDSAKTSCARRKRRSIAESSAYANAKTTSSAY